MAAGIYFDTVDYRITKKGRTWFHGATRSGRPCRIKIDELTADMQPGETYTIFGRIEDVDFELHHRDGQRVRRMDVTALPAGYTLNKGERRAMLLWSIAAIESGIIAGYVAQSAIRRGVQAGPADFPGLQGEFESAISKAYRTAATLGAHEALSDLEHAESDQERETARRSFALALAELERHAAGLALWLRAKYERVNHAIVNRRGEQLTLFAA